VIFNLLLGPYYGIIVTIGRERSRANEVTIVFNSVEAILSHFDVPLSTHAALPRSVAGQRDHAGRRLHHCSSD
jgi:hypothetical protein